MHRITEIRLRIDLYKYNNMFGKIKQGIKNKAMKMMLKKQMANVPPEQQEALMKMIEENPDFFEKVAMEIKEKVDAGGNEMYATMQVMQKYQSEMQAFFAGTAPGAK